MEIIDVRNVNEAVNKGLLYLLDEGIEENSRNGKVLVAPGPVCTIYQKPLERVLFSPLRNANPFFHLMEALWMLAGRNDLEWPMKFNQRFKEYSDDGKTVFGAYGWRWRNDFGYDQLEKIIEELRKNPGSRRCVLSMWNAHEPFSYEDNDVPLLSHGDLYVATHGGKDVPCNTHAYFDLRGGKLNMTVCNRSNDAIWGAYGANAVHFSFLQEYIATKLGKEVGVYRQFSNNFHAYLDIYDKVTLKEIAIDAKQTNIYINNPHLKIVPLETSSEDDIDHSTGLFLDGYPFPTGFIGQVAVPMYAAWVSYKDRDYDKVFDRLSTMPFCDWKIAATQWMERQELKQAIK